MTHEPDAIPQRLDSAAIIAASTWLDVSFVMALQTARFMVVLLVGPPRARFVADRRSHRSAVQQKAGSANLLAQVKSDEDKLD